MSRETSVSLEGGDDAWEVAVVAVGASRLRFALGAPRENPRTIQVFHLQRLKRLDESGGERDLRILARLGAVLEDTGRDVAADPHGARLDVLPLEAGALTNLLEAARIDLIERDGSEDAKDVVLGGTVALLCLELPLVDMAGDEFGPRREDGRALLRFRLGLQFLLSRRRCGALRELRHAPQALPFPPSSCILHRHLVLRGDAPDTIRLSGARIHERDSHLPASPVFAVGAGGHFSRLGLAVQGAGCFASPRVSWRTQSSTSPVLYATARPLRTHGGPSPWDRQRSTVRILHARHVASSVSAPRTVPQGRPAAPAPRAATGMTGCPASC